MSHRYDSPLTLLAVALLEHHAYDAVTHELQVRSTDRDDADALLALTAGRSTDTADGHRCYLGLLPCGLTLRVVTEEVAR